MGRANNLKVEQELTPATEPEQAVESAQVDEFEQTTEPEQAAESGRIYVVRAEHGLNKRTGPGRKFRVIHVLPCGVEVVVIGPMVSVEGSLWAPVDGGWVNSEYLALQAEA